MPLEIHQVGSCEETGPREKQRARSHRERIKEKGEQSHNNFF